MYFHSSYWLGPYKTSKSITNFYACILQMHKCKNIISVERALHTSKHGDLAKAVII